MPDNTIVISFIVPAFNEENNIAGIIASIIKYTDVSYPYEIILMDNGSSDSTVRIAAENGARVFSFPDLTIAGLRNEGVSKMRGEIAVFLDADVRITKDWGRNIGRVIKSLRSRPDIITGSICGVRRDAGWVEMHWMAPEIKKSSVTIMNGGHFIVLRSFFVKVGGFDSLIETGEEGDFCRRARKLGAEIINDKDLKVIHEHYPATIREFFRRERWYGHADYGSFKDFFSSVSALLSMILIFILLGSICLASYYRTLWIFSASIAAFLLISAAAALFRTRRLDKHFFPCALLFVVYFIARIAAFFDILLLRLFNRYRVKKWH